MAAKIGPWGRPRDDAAEFGIQRSRNSGLAWDDIFYDDGNGTRIKHMPIALLSVAFIRQFGEGRYKLRYLRAKGKSPRNLGESVPFEITADPAEVAAETSAARRVVKVKKRVDGGGAPSGVSAEEMLAQLREEREAARAEAREHHEQLRAEREAGRREQVDQMRDLLGLMPAAAQARVAMASDATVAPAWAQALITKLDALEVRVAELDDDEADDDDDETGPDDEDELLDAIEASPVLKYVVKKAKSSSFLGDLLKFVQEHDKHEKLTNGAAAGATGGTQSAQVDTPVGGP